MANSIGESGASSLSEALKVNSSLTQLNLGVSLLLNDDSLLFVIVSHSMDNNIGDSGMKALAGALESNITITSVILWEDEE